MKKETNKSHKLPKSMKQFGISAGLAGTLVSSGKKFLNNISPGSPGSVVLDKVSNTISWFTFQNGPTIIGPAELMLKILKTGKSNRQEGLNQLMQEYKKGTIKISGGIG